MGPILKPLSLALLTVAGWGRAEDFSLKYAPKEGTTITYKLKGNMDISGVQATMDSTVSEKILKVDPDGTYSVQINTLDGKITYSGQEMNVPKNSSVTVYKANGEVVSVSGTQVDPTNTRAQNLTMLKRPDANVKIGDAWQVESKGDATANKPSLHGSFKLVGTEDVGTYHTLKIEATMSEGEVPLPGSTTTTFWLNKDDASIVKYECKYLNMPFPGAPTPMTGDLSMTRVDKP
jgi:hypothetical protein